MAGFVRGKELGGWASKDVAMKQQDQSQRAEVWSYNNFRN